jgi:TerC family integral membrane protein
VSDPLLWVAVAAAVAAALVLDFAVFGRRGLTVRSAAWWSAGWLAVGLGFTAVVVAVSGGAAGAEYATGYVVERSLSLDNLFVFALIFAALGIDGAERLRLLGLGVVIALVLRAGAIAAGAALLDAAHVTVYLFGALLLVTAVKLGKRGEVAIEPERSRAVRALRRIWPGAGLTTVAIVLIAATDVVFAVDSIPAIFAVTDDPLIVFAANAFALVGLRALYVLLADLLVRFVYLDLALAAILGFVGGKMLLTDVWKVPVWLSLVVILGTLGVAVLASLRTERTGHVPPGHPVTPATAPAVDSPRGRRDRA